MAFSLGSLFKNIGTKHGETSVLGIDIGASSAKIVQLREAHGAAILETYGEIALGPYGEQPIGKAVKLSPEKLVEAIKDLIKEANVTARTTGTSIPFSASLVSVIDLPQVDAEALKRIVPIEARKYVPVSFSEVSLDWFVIPHEEGTDSAFDQLQEKKVTRANSQEILLVAIQNAALKAYQVLMSALGLTTDFYEIEIFSTLRSCVSQGLAPVCIVDLGASTTKMYIVERGVVRMTHLLSVGGQQMTEMLARSLEWDFEKAERVKREYGLTPSPAFGSEENEKIKQALLSTLSRVFSEVNRVLLSYGQRYNKNVPSVVLTGGGSALADITGVAKSSLNAEVVIADPFSKTEAPAFLGNVLKQIGPSFAVSVGLALRMLKHR